jgi:vanillate/3-O-methylgallate O-demethylase
MYYLATRGIELDFSMQNVFIFQVTGPTALQVLERATGEDLRDIGSLRTRKVTVAGLETEISRVGRFRGPVA